MVCLANKNFNSLAYDAALIVFIAEILQSIFSSCVSGFNWGRLPIKFLIFRYA